MLNRRTFLFATVTVTLTAQTPKPLILILMGPPGGGKGTQAEKITAEFGIPSVSTGDLLRAEVKSGSALGVQIQAVMQKGDLVSDDIVNRLIADRLSRPDARKGLILDGYPRDVAQAGYLDGLLNERNLPQPLVINLDVAEEEILKRLGQRGRKDDAPETVRSRLGVYARDTKPVLDYYGPSRVRKVDGLGAPEEVYSRVREAIRLAR